MDKKVIIPAAGFGTRMNCKPDESKEMLPDSTTGKPIISYSLELCFDLGVRPLIITRPEKQDLISYINEMYPETEIFTAEDSGQEWPATILKSRALWADNNVLMLPDTRFEPKEQVVRTMFELLPFYNTVFATHKVKDITKWGALKFSNENTYLACEKPIYNQGEGTAWGLIGFKNNSQGVDLFNYCLKKRPEWFIIRDTITLSLDSFEDITRNE